MSGEVPWISLVILYGTAVSAMALLAFILVWIRESLFRFNWL